ncbi:hypothetical protein [Asanoa siamensis]|nr:hypothetical protein [Asanoa siamensis]
MRRSLAVPLIALALGLAACGSAGPPPGVATAGGGTPTADASAAAADDGEQGRAFAACMRENGIDMPDPQPGAEGGLGVALDKLDKTKVLDAVDACRDLMPGGGKDVKLGPEQIERQRVLAECMRANGVPDFPDPDPDGGAAVREYILDKHDDDVLAALEKCRDVLPTPSGRPGVRK